MNKIKAIGIVSIVILALMIGIGCTDDSDIGSDIYTKPTPQFQDFEKYTVLEDGHIQRYSLDYTVDVCNIEISSDEKVNIYIMSSEADYYKWKYGEACTHYPNYEASEVYSYDRVVSVSKEAYLVIENPSTFGLGDSANVKTTITVTY